MKIFFWEFKNSNDIIRYQFTSNIDNGRCSFSISPSSSTYLSLSIKPGNTINDASSKSYLSPLIFWPLFFSYFWNYSKRDINSINWVISSKYLLIFCSAILLHWSIQRVVEYQGRIWKQSECKINMSIGSGTYC